MGTMHDPSENETPFMRSVGGRSRLAPETDDRRDEVVGGNLIRAAAPGVTAS